ncbi:hypothetical protein NMY22_g801 [Coprinellus aureogranulatus]|nr:hypothetical protein NMY22_g801 [Coprinellus aureogranulatus]
MRQHERDSVGVRERGGFGVPRTESLSKPSTFLTQSAVSSPTSCSDSSPVWWWTCMPRSTSSTSVGSPSTNFVRPCQCERPPITSPPTRSVNTSTLHRLTLADLTISAATPSGHSIHSAPSQVLFNPATTAQHDTTSALGGEAPPSKRSKAVTPLDEPPSARSQPNPPAVAEAASVSPAA